MKKKFNFVALFLLVVLLFSSCQSVVSGTHGEEYSAITYLSEYFGAGYQDNTIPVTISSFKDELQKVNPNYDRSGNNMIDAALIAAGYKELPGTYDKNKIAERTTWYYIPNKLKGVSDASYYAFLDANLGTAEMLKRGEINANVANEIILRVANALGSGRRYVGFISDSDLADKLRSTYDGFILFDDDVLADIGYSLIREGKSTGYNLKTDAYASRFLSEYSLTYSHDNIEHALQLIALLNSEKIDARVALEPKISIYQYLLDWGPIPEPSRHYRVVESDGMYLVNAIEFDLVIEFSKKDDKERFNSIILKNAKKNDSNPELIGLIKGSWWQPLYTSKTKMRTGEFYSIVNNQLFHNGYSINPFTTTDKTIDYTQYMKKYPNEVLTAVPQNLTVNKAFYNYLTGSDYQ